MANYRRMFISGGTYFFTVCLADRSDQLLTDRIVELRHAYHRTYQSAPFMCHAMVVLPDHLHAVWTLPPGDQDFSGRWRQFKSRFTRSLGEERPRPRSKTRKRERGLWQRRFWEHAIRDETDFQRHVRYCWMNPVKHGLVERPTDWAFSSIHRDILRGAVDPQVSDQFEDGDFGEAA